MKRTLLYSIAFVLTIAATGQTLNVKVGNITYQFPASLTGEMIYDRGKTVTIMGKKLWLDEIEEMTIDDTAVKDNNVSINYDGSTANITIAGNVAQYVDVETNDAHVTINQTNSVISDRWSGEGTKVTVKPNLKSREAVFNTVQFDVWNSLNS